MNRDLPLILVVCTGNSCRSQMAHAFLARALEGKARVESAGSKPSGYVHPKAIQVMQEKGYDLTTHESENLDLYLSQSITTCVTVCGNAKEECPCMPSTICYHWEFQDPADATGTEEEVLGVFRAIRDEIEEVFMGRLDQLLPDGESIALS